MKIGVFGNTNNYPYLLAKALRELGYDVCLIVDSKYRLHRPENRNWRYRFFYPSWIKDYSGIEEREYFTKSDRVMKLVRFLETMDVLILNSVGPSLLPLMNPASRPKAVTILAGSDLTYYASSDLAEIRSLPWPRDFKETDEGRKEMALADDLVKRQREGIASSMAVSYFPSGINPDGDRIFTEIEADHLRTFMVYQAATDEVRYSPPPNNARVRTFCATRLTWGKLLPQRTGLDYKGSDIMIRGIGVFYRKTGIPLDVHLVRKGDNIAETEALVKECGLESQVTWHDEMSLMEIWRQFRLSDIIFEQLGDHSMIGMAGLDAFATGRPLIANGRQEVDFFKLPVCQAKTPEEVAAQLETLARDPALRAEIGRANRLYAEQNLSPAANAWKCVEIFRMAGEN